jgi:hypothetical protein
MMTVSVVMTIVWMCIEGVAAAGTDYVEGFYRDCFGLAVIVACYAALSTEVNGSFFEQMRSARWDGEDVDKHLDLISLDDPPILPIGVLRRNRLVLVCLHRKIMSSWNLLWHRRLQEKLLWMQV